MAEAMSEERLADIGAALTVAGGPTIAHELLAEVERLHAWDGLMSLLDRHYPADVFDGSSGDPGPRIIALTREIDHLRAQLAEMTRCRDNAMAYAAREHVPIDLDDEIDIDGEVLADRIEGELLGPGWDWEDDRTPGQLARTAVAVIRPHLARLTDQAQQARARLAEIGETREKWAVRWPSAGGDYSYELCEDEQDAREAIPDDDDTCEIVKRVVGGWQQVAR